MSVTTMEESGPRKKRRRSSLAPSRNKLELSPSIGKDLHKTIDKALSAEERIEELCKLCVQCAVGHVSRDFDTEEELQYLSEVNTVLLDCLTAQEVKEARFAVCHAGNLQPNPDNLEMDMTIQEYETRINRLKREEEDWNNLFKDLETKAAEAERLSERKTLPESELTEEQINMSGNYLPHFIDLNTFGTEVCNSLRKLKLLVRQHEKNISSNWKIQQNVSEVLDMKIAELRRKTFGNLESPRKLIQHDLPTPPSTPSSDGR